MLKNPKFYKYLGFALFICSAIVTMQFMWSSAIGFIAFLIASTQGVAIEACKTGFVYVTISVKEIGWKVFFGTLAFIAFIFSVVFTFGYSSNMNNKIKNEAMYSSDKYAQQQDDSTRQKDLYGETKKAIEDLKTQRDTQIKGMEDARDQLPKNFRSQRVIETDKINKAKADYQTKIEAKEAALKGSDEKLSGIKTEELPEDGYLTMYQLFAKSINTVFAPKPKGKVTAKPWTAEDVEFWFQMAISLFLEFAGIGCLIYSQYINADEKPIVTPKKAPIASSNSGIGFKPQTATATKQYYEDDDEPSAYMPAKRPIGFQTSSTVTASATLNPKIEGVKSRGSFDTHNVENNNKDSSHSLIAESPEPFATHNVHEIDNIVLGYYLDYVFDNVKPDKSIPGYQTTTKDLNQKYNLGLGIDYIRKLKNHCEHLNILKSDSVSRKTYIVKRKQEIKV